MEDYILIKPTDHCNLLRFLHNPVGKCTGCLSFTDTRLNSKSHRTSANNIIGLIERLQSVARSAVDINNNNNNNNNKVKGNNDNNKKNKNKNKNKRIRERDHIFSEADRVVFPRLKSGKHPYSDSYTYVFHIWLPSLWLFMLLIHT